MNRIASLVTAIALTVTGGATATAHDAKPHRTQEASAPSWAPFGTKPCTVEDADGPCYWDAGSAGNGRGTSFYVIPLDRTHKSYTYPFAHRFDEVTSRDY